MNLAQQMKAMAYGSIPLNLSEIYTKVLKEISDSAGVGLFCVEVDVDTPSSKKVLQLLKADGFDAAILPTLTFFDDVETKTIYISWNVA